MQQAYTNTRDANDAQNLLYTFPFFRRSSFVGASFFFFSWRVHSGQNWNRQNPLDRSSDRHCQPASPQHKCAHTENSCICVWMKLSLPTEFCICTESERVSEEKPHSLWICECWIGCCFFARFLSFFHSLSLEKIFMWACDIKFIYCFRHQTHPHFYARVRCFMQRARATFMNEGLRLDLKKKRNKSNDVNEESAIASELSWISGSFPLRSFGKDPQEWKYNGPRLIVPYTFFLLLTHSLSLWLCCCCYCLFQVRAFPSADRFMVSLAYEDDDKFLEPPYFNAHTI